ncbi:SSI family serine proteinase inhibitor [Streptomyces sp. NPDC057638]|uniref:SSI family serine proteinase inhibitor n=1 Tax=Streptomyces sp. NPDC057638 TaxID=3346190 RepID=UPI0036CD627E
MLRRIALTTSASLVMIAASASAAGAVASPFPLVPFVSGVAGSGAAPEPGASAPEPAERAEPVERTEPTEPQEPAEPTEPAEPAEPAESAEPAAPRGQARAGSQGRWVAPESDRLTVTISETGNTRTDGRYELQCGPTGGTHPAAEAACGRLDELAGGEADPFAPVPEGTYCTQQTGGPATARVTGTWRGQPVDATFTQVDGCEISRWQNLEPILPSTRS